MDGKIMIGLIMLALGGLLLLQKLGYIDGIGDYFGPLVLIAVGLSFLFAKSKDWYDKKYDKDIDEI